MKQDSALLQSVASYYEGKLDHYGLTPRGVDWKDERSQNIRFDQIVRLLPLDRQVSVLDYGCGYGALYGYLRAKGFRGQYTGFDLSGKMIDAALAAHRDGMTPVFHNSPGALQKADYVLASGIFNVKLDWPDTKWRAYVEDTIGQLVSLASRGVAFNILTSHSDPDRMRPNLYYANPAELLDFCLRTFSRSVSIDHNYELYEFTVHIGLPDHPQAGRGG